MWRCYMLQISSMYVQDFKSVVHETKQTKSNITAQNSFSHFKIVLFLCSGVLGY